MGHQQNLANRRLAKHEGISISQLVASTAAQEVAALMTEQYMEECARRGSREKFRAVLARVPDVPPLPQDAL